MRFRFHTTSRALAYAALAAGLGGASFSPAPDGPAPAGGPIHADMFVDVQPDQGTLKVRLAMDVEEKNAKRFIPAGDPSGVLKADGRVLPGRPESRPGDAQERDQQDEARGQKKDPGAQTRPIIETLEPIMGEGIGHGPGEGAGDADQDEHIPGDQTQDGGQGRPQNFPDADFLFLLFDDEGDQAEQSDGGDRYGDDGKARDYSGQPVLVPIKVVEDFVHG